MVQMLVSDIRIMLLTDCSGRRRTCAFGRELEFGSDKGDPVIFVNIPDCVISVKRADCTEKKTS